MKLTLGFSPCPNDTFIFDALVNGNIDTGGLEFDYVMEDVETLNVWATEGKLDITKLSYSTFLKTVAQYALLHSGSALGKGVGPLLVARQPVAATDIDTLKIAIPGFKTTANLLFTLAHPGARDKTEMVFSDIESAVLSGDFDAGLMIHEGRFTYQKKGLHKLMDLGDWWEQTTGAAIPLGGIVMHRRFPAQLCARVDALIKQSLALSWAQYPELSPFVTCNAQEMEPDVMRKHIDLYVNEYTTDLGEIGERAIATLFARAQQAGIIPPSDRSVFY
jgi:1,4-dihydroxy-6-naphthoate synthase